MYYYISKNVANLHIKPKKMSEVGSQAIYGTFIKILKKEKKWFYIQTPDKYQGWVLQEHVIAKNSAYTNNLASIKPLWAHIHYVEDTTPYPPIITLPFETKIEIVSSKKEFCNRWIRVKLLDEKIYYAQSRDFEFNPKILSIEEMVRFSKKFLDIPYYWGGNSSFGYDCSGFSQMLYRQMKIFIFKDSFKQAIDPNLKDVELKDLKKGDLLFFGDKKISHVAIYLGNKKIIHAATKNVRPKIQISSFRGLDFKKIISIKRKKHKYTFPFAN